MGCRLAGMGGRGHCRVVKGRVRMARVRLFLFRGGDWKTLQRTGQGRVQLDRAKCQLF